MGDPHMPRIANTELERLRKAKMNSHEGTPGCYKIVSNGFDSLPSDLLARL